MMVLDENRRLDSSDRGLSDLESMLYRDRNHPSVIIWGMENEESLEGTPIGRRVIDRLVRRTRRIDPTRPTTASQNHGHVWEYTGKTTLAGFNYGNGGKDVAYHLKHPGQPVIGTETNATPTTRGIYADDKKRGYVNAYGTTISPPPYQWNTGFETSWQAYLKHPFLTGVFIWSGFDYRGEPSPYKWPCVNSHYGVIDTAGFPKDGYYYHKAMFSSEPVLHLIPHWTWPGREGREIKVWVLTNLERVELRLNGRYLGGQQVPAGSHAEFMVRYEPGELKATGYREGRVVAETVVATCGRPAAIRVEPDRTKMEPDGHDAVPIRIAVVDSAGRIVPTAGPLVRFAVSGPSLILGVGNGNPSSHEPDKAERRRAFNGLCLAIVQSVGKKGKVVFTARSAGLRPARCGIKVC
jgi:beta-galactosidase